MAAIWPTAEEWAVVGLSARIALAATAIAFVPAVAIAWGLARRRLPLGFAWLVAVNAPLVAPPVVTGYALLVVFAPDAPVGRALGALGIDVAFTGLGAAVAAAVVAFPLLVRSAQVAFEAVDPGLEQAARTLGAGPWRVFRTVTLPLAARGVAAGAVLAFARSLGEFGATIMLAGSIPGQTRTVPLEVFALAQRTGTDASIARLIVCSLLLALASLAVSEWLARRARQAVRA